MLVALREDVLVGSISGGAIREPLGDYDAELYALYLLTQAQRAGTGTLLLRRLAAVPAQEGWKSMVVWALEENGCSRFNEGLGAVAVSTKQRAIGGAMLMLIAYGWPNLQALLPI